MQTEESPSKKYFRKVLDTINDNNRRTMFIRKKFRRSTKQRLQINWLMKQQQIWWTQAKWNRQENEPLRIEMYD